MGARGAGDGSSSSVYKSDRRAVSKVVGVVLMVAIVVALASTVAVMLTGFSGFLNDPAPQASFSFEYDDDVDDPTAYHPDIEPGTSELVLVEHTGGDAVDTDNLILEVTGVHEDGHTETVTIPWNETTDGDIASLSVTNKAYPRVVGDDWTFKNGGEVAIYWIDDSGTGTVLASWSR